MYRYTDECTNIKVCPCIRTWEIVHEAGLCCYNPLSPGLTNDGDVIEGLLIKSGQTATKTLRHIVGFLI